jgi:CBS domain-containing protein
LSAPDAKAFFEQIAPFDRLREGELARLVNAASPTEYVPGQTILRRFDIPEHLHVVIDGVIEEADSSGPVGRYSTGDAFDSRALIEGRCQHGFVSRGQASCYLVPVPLILTLTRTNRRFRDFFHEDVTRRQEALVSVQQQREAASLLTMRIGERGLRPPVFADPGTSIQQAVALMKTHRTSALLVRRDDRVGIFTGRDVRERSVLMGLPDSTAIDDLASYDLITIERDDLLFNAFVTMTRHAIRHVVVTEGPAILGVLEQADLLSHLSDTSYFIAHQVDRATSPEALKEAGGRIPQFVRSLYDRGVKPRYIARLVTDLNRKIMARLYRQMASADLLADACLIVMGSEGRGEQLLRTDQDNGIIFRDGTPPPGFDEVSRAFPEALVELGYPPCPGNVMVSNPAWAKSRDGYRESLRAWIHQPSSDGFMNLAIFFDASAIAGDAELLAELKAYLFELIGGQENVVRHFARAIQSFETPLGFFNRLVVEKAGPHAGKLDIKKGGIFPVVHGVRSLALEYRLAETNTIGRIQALSGRPPFEEGFTADLIEAFEFMSMIRLRTQLDQWDLEGRTHNYVDPKRLTKLERGLLQDSLKIVKHFKAMLGHHFKLSMVS